MAQQTYSVLSTEHATDKDAFRPASIKLVRKQPHKWSAPNFARWRSFGWDVEQDSLPEHLRELMP